MATILMKRWFMKNHHFKTSPLELVHCQDTENWQQYFTYRLVSEERWGRHKWDLTKVLKTWLKRSSILFLPHPETHWASRIQSSYSENQSGSGRRKTFRPQRTTTACLGVGNHGDKLKHHHTHIFNLDAVHRYWPPKLNSGPCKAPVAP